MSPRVLFTALVGFACLSARSAPLSLEQVRLKDTQFMLQGRTITMTGQSFDIQVPDVRIQTESDIVRAEVDLQKLRVYINHINVRKWFSTDCYHTYIFVGYHRPVTFATAVPIRVNAGVVEVGQAGLSFEIPASEFSTQGPAYCRGKFFGKPLMKKIVAKAISQSKSQVEETLKNAVKGIFP